MKQTPIISIIILALIILNSCASMSSQNTASKSLLDNQIDNLSKQFVKTLSSENKSTLAIMDFVNLDGSQSMFGKYLREELTIRIFRTNKVSVVERGMLEEVMEEWNFGAKGFVSEKTASRIGQLLGVEAITIGTITDLGEVIKINARIIEVETGKLISVASVHLTKDSTVLTLMNAKEHIIQEKLKSDLKEEVETEKKSIVVKNETSKKITFEDKGIKFYIDKAEYSKSSNNLLFTGYVIAQETDKKLRFNSKYLQVITDNGNSYYGKSMKVGLVKDFNGTVDLIEGIRTDMEINIGKFESIPKKILRLQVQHGWSEYNLGGIKFSLKPNMSIDLVD